MRFLAGGWMGAVIYGAAALWALACTSSDGGGGDDDSTECERGTESCDCLDGACLAGLTCLSEKCVRETGGTGGTQGGSAGAATGGNPQAGSGANPSGGAGGGMGGSATGGTGGAGGTVTGGVGGAMAGASGSAGASGGSGGSAGAGGPGGSAGMCTADTQTDAQHCGSCGRVCRAYENIGDTCDTAPCCRAGMCADDFGACIVASDGFETCAEYCASIGEECVRQGCGTNTYRAWAGRDSCENFAASVGDYNDPCDAPIDFGSAIIRCCCTDDAP